MVLSAILRVRALLPSNSLSTLRRCLHASLVRSVDGTPIKMPSLSPTMSEGSIVKWYKSEGDELQPGDVLCDIQTDKAVVSLENEEEGVLAKIIKDDSGGDIKVGEVIALYVDPGEDWRSVENPAGTVASSAENVPASSSKPAPAEPTKHSAKLGPAVRNLRNTYDVDLSKVTATGPQNNVLKEDILEYIRANNLKPKDFTVSAPEAPEKKQQPKAKPAAAAINQQPANSFVDIPLSETAIHNMKTLTESKMALAHSYTYCDASLDELESLQERLLAEEGVSVDLEDMLAKCVGYAMMMCPRFRCVRSRDDSVVQSDRADLCWISVCEQGTVTGSVLHDVGSAMVSTISNERQHQCVSISRELISPATGTSPIPLTVTNFLSCSVASVTETLLKPQCASLTVGGRHRRAGLEGKGESCVSLSLSYDAEVITEMEAAEFMESLVGIMASPRLIHSAARSRELP